MTKSQRTWSVAKAKAQLSTVIDRALADGPQTITRRGRKAVVPANTWERQRRHKGNLAEFFASSPLRGARVRIRRLQGESRKIDL